MVGLLKIFLMKAVSDSVVWTARGNSFYHLVTYTQESLDACLPRCLEGWWVNRRHAMGLKGMRCEARVISALKKEGKGQILTLYL